MVIHLYIKLHLLSTTLASLLSVCLYSIASYIRTVFSNPSLCLSVTYLWRINRNAVYVLKYSFIFSTNYNSSMLLCDCFCFVVKSYRNFYFRARILPFSSLTHPKDPPQCFGFCIVVTSKHLPNTQVNNNVFSHCEFGLISMNIIYLVFLQLEWIHRSGRFIKLPLK